MERIRVEQCAYIKIEQNYRDFLMRQVQRSIRDKRPDLVDRAIFLHDNPRPHKAECVHNYSDIGDGKNWSTHIHSRHFTQ
ncbi:hypothetical protein TNCV_4591371 [Trichonephila clavipes]|nr:hypothetical protein TNCV_4591371 [Trichonephila clavipes]